MIEKPKERQIGRCDTQSESQRVSESRGDPPRGALRSRMRTACDLACGPRSEIARVHACGPARLSCAISHAGSHALAHAAAQRGRARDLTRNSARGLARGLAHALARVLARGPLRESPREPRCPCRRCLLPSDRRPQWPPLPRGERGVSDDLAPRPQPLPRAVPAAGTSAECAAKLYWHPLSSTRWRASWGSCLQRAEAIDGANDSGAVLRQVRGRVRLRRPTPWAGRVRDTSPWTEPPVNAWVW